MLSRRPLWRGPTLTMLSATSESQTANRVGDHVIQRIAVGFAVVALAATAGVISLATPAHADSWSGWRHCNHQPPVQYTLYVRSEPDPGFVNHLRDNQLVRSWSNVYRQTRISLHGTGYQLAQINTGGTLWVGSAQCNPLPG